MFEGLCDKVNILMAAQKVSVLQLARHTGLPPTTIKKLRNKESVNPTLCTLTALAQYFNVSFDYLLGDTNTQSNTLRLPEQHYSYPIIPWEEIRNFSSLPASQAYYPMAVSAQDYGDGAFALRVSSEDWNIFPNGTILFIALTVSPIHQDYVIAAKTNQPPTLKQLLCEDDEKYLLSLSVTQRVLPFTGDYHLFGVIVESQRQFKMMGQKMGMKNEFDEISKKESIRRKESLIIACEI